MKKIIGIVGSRSRNSDEDYWIVRKKFKEIYEYGDWICSGGCPKGADYFAFTLYREFKTPYLEFPANWDKYGKGAGFIPNTDIAKASCILIACVTDDRTGGTEDTVKKYIQFHGDERLHLV